MINKNTLKYPPYNWKQIHDSSLIIPHFKNNYRGKVGRICRGQNNTNLYTELGGAWINLNSFQGQLKFKSQPSRRFPMSRSKQSSCWRQLQFQCQWEESANKSASNWNPWEELEPKGKIKYKTFFYYFPPTGIRTPTSTIQD